VATIQVYYDTATITSEKSFTVQAPCNLDLVCIPGGKVIKNFTAVIYQFS